MTTPNPHGQTKAESFILVLTDFFQVERQRRRARRRQVLKDHSQRTLQAFPADFDESRILSEWMPRNKQSWHESIRELLAD